MRWFGLHVLIASAMFIVSGARADGSGEAEGPQHVLPVRGGAAETERRDWLDLYDRFCEDCEERYGTRVSLLVNSQGQLLVSGEGDEGKGKSAFSYNIYITQQLWPGAELNVVGQGGSGRGIDSLVDSTLGFNGDAGEPRCAYVSRLYVSQMLFDERLQVAAGKLDLTDWFDASEVANDENTQFLAPALVNNPTIPFPDYAIGGLVNYQPAQWLYIMAGVADAQAVGTEMGTNTAFHGEDYFFGIAEVGVRPEIAGRAGNYRLMFWYDPQPLEPFDGSDDKRDDAGFAISFDQQLTDGLTGFFRYGFAHEDVRELSGFWSLGAQLAEPVAGRGDDVLGLAVAQAIRSDDLQAVEGGSDTETQFEIYYRIQVTPWMSISPDVQLILNPAGDRDNDPALVVGARAVLEF